MKKTMLLFGALLTVGLASAQTHNKKPASSAVTYIEYTRRPKVQNDSIIKPSMHVPVQADKSSNVSTANVSALNNNPEPETYTITSKSKKGKK